jgi:hypothetical protein
LNFSQLWQLCSIKLMPTASDLSAARLLCGNLRGRNMVFELVRDTLCPVLPELNLDPIWERFIAAYEEPYQDSDPPQTDAEIRAVLNWDADFHIPGREHMSSESDPVLGGSEDEEEHNSPADLRRAAI